MTLTPRFTAPLLACCLACSFAGGLFSQSGPLRAEESPALSLAPISCMIVPWREARLGLDLAGIVAARHVSRNDSVTAGQLLVQLQSGLAEADLARAGLTHAELTARLERSEGLARNNVIARDEIEKLRVETSLAGVELRAAEEKLRKTALLAPFDGVITSTSVEAGELTGPAALMTLAEIARLKAVVILPAEAWGQFSTGQDIGLSLPLTGQQRRGEVFSIDGFIDPSANSFSMEVSLDNPALDLPPGAACLVSP